MRKLFLTICVTWSFVMTGMGNPVDVINDDFKKTTLVKLVINQGADERPKSLLGEIIFTREIKNNKPGQVELNFKMDMSPEFNDVEKKFYLKTDVSQHEMVIQRFEREMKSQNELIGTRQRKVTRIKVILPKPVEDEMLNTNQLVIRLYVGDQQATYTVRRGQLKDIKKFISTVSVK
ncbi:MAG: hypothetical protein KA369_06605 [Spirochaetes bacterium]|nr:hypothetical protein [Spirochaetota bacterium]